VKKAWVNFSACQYWSSRTNWSGSIASV